MAREVPLAFASDSTVQARPRSRCTLEPCKPNRATAAAHGFGHDLASPLDAFFIHVKADRDLAIAAVIFGLLAYRRVAPLAIMVATLLIAPACDMALVMSEGRIGYALMVHGSAIAYGLVLIALLRRARARYR